MATNKSAMKRTRQAEKHRIRNAAVKSAIKTTLKSVLKAVEGKDKTAAISALKKATPLLDKARSKGVLHKNTVSRKISRITKKVNTLLK